MTIWVEDIDRYTPGLPDFLKLVVPQWDEQEALYWLADTAGEDFSRIYVGNLRIDKETVGPSEEFPEIWYFTLTVRPRNQ